MAYGLSNGCVTDDVMSHHPKGAVRQYLVCYPNDSLASCY